MKLINLTPHDVRIIRDEGDLIICPSGNAARAVMREEPAGTIAGIPITRRVLDHVEGLPPETAGIRYIVSALTAQCVPERTDIVIVRDFVRDDNGTVIGCKGLSRLN